MDRFFRYGDRSYGALSSWIEMLGDIHFAMTWKFKSIHLYQMLTEIGIGETIETILMPDGFETKTRNHLVLMCMWLNMSKAASFLLNFHDSIKVQVDKVQLELAHLMELIDHWGSAPCTTSREPPKDNRDRSSSRSRFKWRGRRGRGSTTPRSPSPGKTDDWTNTPTLELAISSRKEGASSASDWSIAPSQGDVCKKGGWDGWRDPEPDRSVPPV
eukprot:Gb_36439 [translate_table: standard]